MNGIFFVLFILSVIMLLFTSPETVLSSMLKGGESAVTLTITMTAIYAVWLGMLSVAEKSGITQKIAKLLNSPIKFIFGNVSKKAGECLAMNISANLLGMGGVATPIGIEAAKNLDVDKNVYAMNMLFVISATSIQLLPTSVISLRAEAGSTSASDIILPTFIATAISTIIAVAITHIIYAKKKI